MIAVIVFLVTAVVSYLYSLIVHGSGQSDIASAVRLGICMGIVLTWLDRRRK
ncbi:MAG: hypothetical protein QME69_05200 [Candidatus Saccharicenans sp.]|nr:hypothetical protein [Candidatus Saccharicenans sp.]